MMASGTISGPKPSQYGSMLELCWGGTKEVQLTNNETRKFLMDNDTVIMKGFSIDENIKIGFGQVENKIIG